MTRSETERANRAAADAAPVLFASWKLEGGELVRRMSQPSEDRILELNQRIRIEEPLKHLGWGQWVLQVPELHWWRLKKKYPDLNAPHGPTRTKAWLTLMAAPDGDQSRVRERDRARI